MQAVRNIACISLATNLPALPMVPHVVANAYKNLLAIAVMTDITFKEAEKVDITVRKAQFQCSVSMIFA